MADQQKVRGRPGIIPQALCRDANLSATAKVVFALLTTYEVAYPGQEWLAAHVPCSKPTLNLALKELELHGWIKREIRNRRGGETTLYHVYIDGPIPMESRPDWVRDAWKAGLSSRDLLKQIKLNRLSKSGELEKYRSISQEEVYRQDKEREEAAGPPEASRGSPSKKNGNDPALEAAAREVLEALNAMADRKFRPCDSSLKPIRARLKEGFTVDDCKTVIAFKVAEWGADPTMSQYLRPDTLFRPSKFPGYLAAAKAWDARGCPPLNGHKRCSENPLRFPANERGADYYRQALMRRREVANGAR